MMHHSEWIAKYVQEEIKREITKERERIVNELEKLRTSFVFTQTEQPVLIAKIMNAITGDCNKLR